MEEKVIECPYCGKEFHNFNSLSKHVVRYKVHGDVTKEKLLCDVKYGGVRPLCKCGCGEETPISYQGGAHFCDYVQGHQSRVVNNWGHNEHAKKKSAETRSQQYKSGERQQWNKGVKWVESYDEETVKKLQSILHSKERAERISNSLKGVPKTAEQVEKMRQYMLRADVRKRYSNLMRKRIDNGTFTISSNAEKKFIDEAIKPLGVDYSTQHYLKDLKHYCDVFVPKKNIIIEFQGDYWHGNPQKYDISELSEHQMRKVAKDKELRDYCSKHGIKLVEVWESDYKKHNTSVKESIRRLLID